MKRLIPIVLLIDEGAPVGPLVDALRAMGDKSGRTLSGIVPGAEHAAELAQLLQGHLETGCQVFTLTKVEPPKPAHTNVIDLPARKRHMPWRRVPNDQPPPVAA